MTTWIHFIGGKIYTPSRFIREAQKYGITRNAPLSHIKNMNFGDTVVLAMKIDGECFAFAEMVIKGVTLPSVLAEQVSRSVETKFLSAGGEIVNRECGSYIMGASYSVTCPMAEIVEIARKIAKQDGSAEIRVMVCGTISRVYEKLDPIKFPFFMGFKRIGDDNSMQEDGSVSGVIDYRQVRRKTKRASRTDLSDALREFVEATEHEDD